MPLKKQQVTEEINQEEIRSPEANENRNKISPNLQNSANVVLRHKFVVIKGYLKKQDKSQINNLTFHLKELEKKETKQSPESAEGRK